MPQLPQNEPLPGLDPHLAAVLAVLFMAACCLAVLLFHLSREGRRPFSEEFEDTNTVWGLGDVVVVALVGGAITVLIFATDAAMTGQVTGKPTLSGWVLLRGLVVQNVVLVLVALLWIRRRYGLGVRDLGLRTDGWRREVALGVPLGLGLCAGADVVQRLTEGALSKLTGASMAAELMDRYGTANIVDSLIADLPRWGIAAAVVIVSTVVPVGEELLFRGLTYTALRHRFGVTVALLASGLIFATLHASPADFAALFLVGTALAWVFECRQSLVAPMVAHGLNNLLSVWLLMAAGG